MRIFWLGMHKVLIKTELPRLRLLGYEVFNPPYLSDIIDQSAVKEWSRNSQCTLPDDIQKKLSNYNFYYNSISEEVSEILNAFFDVVIVTINPDWLVNILKAYKGKVIYRTYGQPFSLSEHFQTHNLIPLIDDRDNFTFVPHNKITTAIEHSWLLERMRVVPYSLPDDVFLLRDSWSSSRSNGEIGLLCPRIDNPYYAVNYDHLKVYFNSPEYKIFGMQVNKYDDDQLVGSIDRTDILRKFQALSGFYYHYHEKAVAYLPPLEFMTIGGPVILKKNSLLARMFEPDAPGLVEHDSEVPTLVKRLITKDKEFISELIASQEPVRKFYSPEYVWPIFDKTFNELIISDNRSDAPRIIFNPTIDVKTAKLNSNIKSEVSEKIVILFHSFGSFVEMREGEYMCSEGVAKVARVVVKAISLQSLKPIEILVTSQYEHAQLIYGFFRSVVNNPAIKVRIYIVGGKKSNLRLRNFLKKNNTIRKLYYLAQDFTYYAANPSNLMKFRSLRMRNIAQKYMVPLFGRTKGKKKEALPQETSIPIKKKRRLTQVVSEHISGSKIKPFYNDAQGAYIAKMNDLENVKAVFIPHYYMFPEAIKLKHKCILYLPDHMPHLMPKNTFPNQKRNDEIGYNLVKNASAVLTNSRYSADYLPDCALQVPKNKIRYFPLPNLIVDEDKLLDSESDISIIDSLKLEKYKYVFYPTQNRPNKRLLDLIRVMDMYNKKFKSESDEKKGALDLVLTCNETPELVNISNFTKIRFATQISDSKIKELYKNALCLCFTSVLEGNFPTQVKEAILYRTAVVATSIPLITRELGKLSEQLLLCDRDDLSSYVDSIESIQKNRDACIEQQEAVRKFLISEHSIENFAENVLNLVDNL